MGLWDSVTRLIAVNALQPVEPQLQTRSDSIDDLIARLGNRAQPWRAPSIKQAMGTPAIFRAVSLIANTTGSLAVEAYRNGVKLGDLDTPRVIQRPDPFKTPRAFYRDSAFYLATRGECWWWVAKRDMDNLALSLIVVPPWEIKVIPNERDRLRPTIKWFDREMPREDMRQITFLPSEDGYRGIGPLQACGAAVSVAVEAQEWAANFYAEGGKGGTIIKAAGELSPLVNEDGLSEADLLRAQWVDRANNLVRVIDSGVESVEEHEPNESGAQMLESRQHENGNAARMFGIPGSLLEYQQAGSSLTYQNLEGEFTKFVKASLAPGYLEPIEQEMSDLLTRSTVARFNVKGFQRADVKTRFEVYKIGIDTGIMTVEMAQAEEGIIPGDIEFAPVPFSLPQAVPVLLSFQARSALPVRCNGQRIRKMAGIAQLTTCGRLLGPMYIGKCPRCGKLYETALSA